jgi:hypothetical protein
MTPDDGIERIALAARVWGCIDARFEEAHAARKIGRKVGVRADPVEGCFACRRIRCSHVTNQASPKLCNPACRYGDQDIIDGWCRVGSSRRGVSPIEAPRRNDLGAPLRGQWEADTFLPSQVDAGDEEGACRIHTQMVRALSTRGCLPFARIGTRVGIAWGCEAAHATATVMSG